MNNKNISLFIIGMLFGMLSSDIVTTEIIKRIGAIHTYSGDFQCIKK